MPSPFPGMDPYLETPHLWPDVHHELISQIQGSLNRALRPRYVARLQLRMYISDNDDPGREALVPGVVAHLLDDEIKEARLEIKHLETGTLVTVIEVLSPSNKIQGARGRSSFMAKREETLATEVHWVEIDLLRAGMPSVTRRPLPPGGYRIVVSPAGNRNMTRCWPVGVRDPLPVIGIPLRGDDPDVPLDLGAVLTAAYDAAAYDMSIDYGRDPDPPLSAADAAWAKRLLRDAGVR